MEYRYLAPIQNEFGELIRMEEKKVEIGDSLMEVFEQTGKEFLRFLPIDIIERFFLENERTLDNRTLSDWINNLHLHVLHGKLGEQESDSYKLYKNGDVHDNPPKDLIQGKDAKKLALIYRSEKWRNQTQFELDEECRKSAEDCGFNIDDLVKDFREMRSGNEKIYYELDEEDDKEEIEKIDEFKREFLLKIVKIYIELRKKGYSHSDITA